jgi:hypothetical protein
MNKPIREVSLSAAEGAARIRKDLKANFPGTKFYVRSARFSQGSSIDIRYTDGPAFTLVEAICEAYGSRGYDGQAEVTTFAPSEHATITEDGLISYRIHSFVSVSRELSDAAKEAIGFDLSRPTWEDDQPRPYQYNELDLRDLSALVAAKAGIRAAGLYALETFA